MKLTDELKKKIDLISLSHVVTTHSFQHVHAP